MAPVVGGDIGFQAMNKSIEAVVELVHFDGEAPWPTIVECPDPYLRISPGLTSEEIGSLVLTACIYNHTEIAPVASETLQAFMNNDGFVLPGGLRFSEGGLVKIIPGCCGGLEGWREWLDVPHGKNAVWAGHDPSPYIEYVEGGVRIWQNEKAEGVNFIELGLSEMEALLQKVVFDLEGFLIQLRKWIESVSPEIRDSFVAYFSENMNIGNVT